MPRRKKRASLGIAKKCNQRKKDKSRRNQETPDEKKSRNESDARRKADQRENESLEQSQERRSQMLGSYHLSQSSQKKSRKQSKSAQKGRKLFEDASRSRSRSPISPNYDNEIFRISADNRAPENPVDQEPSEPFSPIDEDYQLARCASLHIPFSEPVPTIPNEKRGSPMDCRDVKGDGNCFFRAISVWITGAENEHETIRALFVSHVETHREMFSNIIPNFNDWLREMRTMKSWGDESSFIVMAHMLNTNLYVYSGGMHHGRRYQGIWQRFSPDGLNPGCQPTQDNIYLTWTINGDHFQVVLSTFDETILNRQDNAPPSILCHYSSEEFFDSALVEEIESVMEAYESAPALMPSNHPLSDDIDDVYFHVQKNPSSLSYTNRKLLTRAFDWCITCPMKYFNPRVIFQK